MIETFITAAHDTVRGTAHHHGIHGFIDEDISQKSADIIMSRNDYLLTN
jgi:hypothetical protein